MSVTRKEIMPYVFLNHLMTDKFKTGCLSINLLTQLDREHAAKNAILPGVLLRGTTRHPDMLSLREALDELYGARIEPVVRKKGEIHCIGLYSNFVDDRCLPEGEEILGKVAELLGEILLEPNTRGGQLQAEYVDSERENLLDKIRGRINNKRTYALSRMVELMCGGEDFATFRLGTEEEAEHIRTTGLTRHYRELIAAAPIEIFYCGSGELDRVEAALINALETLPRSTPNFDMGTDVRMNSVDEKPRYFTEEMDVTQGKLSLGFRLGDTMAAPNYGAITLFNYVYGGQVNSKLFLNVREKLSLCYYASSVLERHKGLLMVASGIEFDKYQQALDEILAQLQAIRDGNVTEEELLWARKALMTDLKVYLDEPDQLEDFYLQQTILGLQYGVEELGIMVEEVSKEEVIAVANSVQLDTVYFLKGLSRGEETDN